MFMMINNEQRDHFTQLRRELGNSYIIFQRMLVYTHVASYTQSEPFHEWNFHKEVHCHIAHTLQLPRSKNLEYKLYLLYLWLHAC